MRPVYYGYAIEDDYIMSLWDMEKNNEINIDPARVSLGNKQKVWFKCPVCHKSYFTSICYVHSGSGCPYCKIQKLKKKRKNVTNSYTFTPKIVLNESVYTTNLINMWDKSNTIDPKVVSIYSNDRYTFHCKNCGYTFISSPAKLTKSYFTCPKCKM